MIKLYPLLTGYMDARRSMLVHDERSLKDPNFRQLVPLPAYLIEHPELGYVLFDSGCDPNGMNVWSRSRAEAAPLINEDKQFIIERIQNLGINPDKIHTFIMSHLHIDHAGGLYLFKKMEKVYVSQVEYETTLSNYQNNLPNDAHEASDILNWEKANVPWIKISPETKELKIADGMTIINFGSGHSFGMLGLLLNLKNSGNILLVSDCCYVRENAGPPVHLPEIVFDKIGYVNAINRINELRDKFNAKFIAGHDIDQFKELQQKTFWD